MLDECLHIVPQMLKVLGTGKEVLDTFGMFSALKHNMFNPAKLIIMIKLLINKCIAKLKSITYRSRNT